MAMLGGGATSEPKGTNASNSHANENLISTVTFNEDGQLVAARNDGAQESGLGHFASLELVACK